jgi:hypothetical protein
MNKIIVIVITAAVVAVGSGAVQAQTLAAQEYNQLREQRDKAVATATADIERRYTASLEALLKKAMSANDLDLAMAIRGELGTDIMRALQAKLANSYWKLGPKHTGALHADGTTSVTWTDKRGKWKVTGPSTLDVSFGEGDTMNVKVDAAVNTLYLPENAHDRTATRTVAPR